MYNLLLEQRPESHLGTADEFLNCFVVYHTVLHRWPLAGAVAAAFVHGYEYLGDQ